MKIRTTKFGELVGIDFCCSELGKSITSKKATIVHGFYADYDDSINVCGYAYCKIFDYDKIQHCPHCGVAITHEVIDD